ncbi:MAG: peptidoglycan DD-metalloendopeptidase family protein [Chloroflexi bacterium]|nr:peptidoglycan DD-metalloendopeptidase family protein [Chloroflexota bacterium]
MTWFGLSAVSATRRHILQKAVRGAILLVVALSLLGLPTTSSPGLADSLSDRIAASRARQSALRQDIDQQNRLLGNLQSDAAEARSVLTKTGNQLDGINVDQALVRREIQQATTALAKVQARRQALQDQLGQLDQTLDLLEQEIQQGADELDQRRAALGARLADAYRSQNTSLLEQVLDSGSFTDVVSDASAYLAYGDQDAQMAQDIADDQASLDSLRAVTAATRYRTDQLRRAKEDAAADLRAQKAKLADAKARLARLEAKTQAIQKKQMAKARTIAANQRQAKAFIRRQQVAQRKLQRQTAGLLAAAKRAAAKRAAAQRAASQNTGGGGGGGGGGNGMFMWPASGVVTQEYGCTGFYLEPPRGSCAHFHSGIDIANASGTPVRASGAGVVAFAGWTYGGSRAILIGHSGNFASFYGHLSRSVVRSGQRVSKGQIIGYMGNTGNSTGPHLHFEIQRGTTPVNPRSYT